MSETTIAEVQAPEAPPAESLPKRTAKRIQELLEQIKSLKRELEEAQQQIAELREQMRNSQPTPDAIQAVMEEGRGRYYDFDRTINELRLAPRLMELLLAQTEAAFLLYALAVGARYTRQQDKHFSGVTR